MNKREFPLHMVQVKFGSGRQDLSKLFMYFHNVVTCITSIQKTFVRLKGPEFPSPQNGLVENGLVVRQIFKKSLNYFHNIAILSPHRKDMALYLKKLEFSLFYPGSFVPIYDEIGVVVQKKY